MKIVVLVRVCSVVELPLCRDVTLQLGDLEPEVGDECALVRVHRDDDYQHGDFRRDDAVVDALGYNLKVRPTFSLESLLEFSHDFPSLVARNISSARRLLATSLFS